MRRRTVQGLLAAPLSITAASICLAQPVSVALPQKSDVTTVSPLVVSPLAPIPQVGAGATYFTPEELKATAHEAHIEFQEKRDASRDCHGYDRASATKPRQREDRGDFSLEALYTTVSESSQQVERLADAAASATQAAIDARRAAVTGKPDSARLEATELARQAAAKAYQEAQAKAVEARARVSDLQDLIAEKAGGDIRKMQAIEKDMETLASIPGAAARAEFRVIVDDRSAERANNGGVAGLNVPDAFSDLRLTSVAVQPTARDDGSSMIITGKIVNLQHADIAVPPLSIAAIDRYGTTLRVEQVQPTGQARIPEAASYAFRYEFKPMPANTARAVVTFAPFHRTRQTASTEAFCAGSPVSPLR